MLGTAMTSNHIHQVRAALRPRSWPSARLIMIGASLLTRGAVGPWWQASSVACRAKEEEPDWNKVLFAKDSLAIISGLNSDAPIGTKLSFVSGGTGALLWHRSDNLVLALILGGASVIKAGERVECKIKCVIQVVEEAKGPVTQREYEVVQAPAGDSLFGRAVNFFGHERSLGQNGATAAAAAPLLAPFGFDKVRPLLNPQVDMKRREQVSESLLTGVKALDILTPLGRGMSFLVIGPRGSGKTSVGLDAIIAQANSGVRCVYAAIGHTDEELAGTVELLRASKALGNTAIVSSAEGVSIGEQLATICAACSIGERIRDEGGHALVVLDTVKPLVDAWDAFIVGLCDLGRATALAGLIKDAEGRDVSVPADNDEELVNYQGMLVSGAVAQRRGFFSTLFMRPAKLNRGIGGGSMTLLPLVPGRCATGVSKRVDMSKYQTLSEEQKAKIQVVLESKLEQATQAASMPGEMVTEVVEEFISIADGQVVLSDRPPPDSYVINPKLSITRVGTRAYSKAMEAMAPQVRLDLAQAEDAQRFSLDPSDGTVKKYDAYTTRIKAALLQERSKPVMLEEQVGLDNLKRSLLLLLTSQIVILLAVQKGFTDTVSPEDVSSFLRGAMTFVWASAFGAMQEIGSTRQLTAAAEKSILAALKSYLNMRNVIARL